MFKTEWIKIVLSQIHDSSLWLDNGPIKINKSIIHRVTSYPTLDQPKILRSDSNNVTQIGMTIDIITDLLIEFFVRVISHKIYQSSRLNCVPCIVVDGGYKIVKKDNTYDLAELQLQKIMENLGAIRKTKSAQFKFCSIIVCIFFYV